MPDSDKIVIFRTADGREISNDPRYGREQMRAQLQAQQDNVPAETPELPESEDEDVTDENSEDNDGLEDMTVDDLKAHVQDLRDSGTDVDTQGVTKKSQLIAAIRAATSAE